MEREPGSSFNFPPGFRFHPSDEELIIHYLQNKVTSRPLPASVIAEIDLYKYNPWELPDMALFGEDEWFFFSPRDRKYPNGARPNRAAASGFWKATGTDKPIFTCGSKSIGVKKALVFYTGRPPKGTKTDWIMNEYRLNEPIIKPSRLKGSMRLDDWVLCRVQQRGNMLKNASEVRDSRSPDWTRHLPKIEEVQPAKVGCIIDMEDYLYKDCHVLASILSGQTPSPTKTGSSISFEGTNNFTNDGLDKGNYSVTVSSLESNFNPLKRKDSEEYRYQKDNEDLPPRKMLDNNGGNQNQFHDIFNPDSSNTIMDFQELNDIAFTEYIY